MSCDLECQVDELVALQSIYDENCFRTSLPAEALVAEQIKEDVLLGGVFSADINFDEPFIVKLKSLTRETKPKPKDDETNCDQNKDCDTNGRSPQLTSVSLAVTSLPPVVLRFEFPRIYPSSSPPDFSLSSKWMPHQLLSRLSCKLDALWHENEGMEILFTWTSFLKEEAWDFLSLTSPLDLTVDDAPETTNVEEADPRCARDIATCDLLLPAIREHDEAAKERLFKSTLFTCNVCFESQLGATCLQFLPCHHVFCNNCMKEYFLVQIKDGSVQCLTCPEDKCTSMALPFQVKSLVPPDLFTIYDRLLLQTTLDTMVDIIYCPRKPCSSPVMLDLGSTMAACAVCKFVFCYFCKMTYHGVAPCRLQSSKFKELRSSYLAADTQGKEFFEKRYGKAMIRRIFEEHQSETYMEDNCKRCPACKANVSKVDGCNKMTCGHCRRAFCWLCCAVLPTTNPYFHFNAPGGACYNKLFEGVDDNSDDDNDDDEVWEPVLNRFQEEDDDDFVVFANVGD